MTLEKRCPTHSKCCAGVNADADASCELTLYGCLVIPVLPFPPNAGADPGCGQGGGQVLRPKVADIAKRSCVSEVSNLWLGSRACLRALEAFGVLMLKYAFSHILETLFL